MGLKKKPLTTTRFVFLPDAHVGWELFSSHGKKEVRPTHNEKAIKAVMKFCEDFQPHVAILGGDQMNFGPISHWTKGFPRLREGFRLQKEYDAFEELVLTPLEATLAKPARKCWIMGNHDAWIVKYIWENPSLEGLIEPQNYFKLEKRGWDIYDVGEGPSVGKVHFVHGDVVLRGGGGPHPAKKLVEAYRRNIRAGHLHKYDAATEQTPVDSKDFHTGIIVPSLSTRFPEYIKNAPTCHINGFLFGEVLSTGDFVDTVVIINKNKFIVGGKLYE